MAKTNKDYLQETLTDDQQEWFDGMVSDHHGECEKLERKLSDEKDKNERLSDELTEMDKKQFDGIEINAGIGTIRYETEGSLDIVQLMEAFAEAIKNHGATKVLRDLERTYAV